MAKEIELTQGFVALVDDIDFEHLSQFHWCCSKGYAIRKGPNNTTIAMHRVILEKKLGRELTTKEKADHRDRNRSNNTRDNLRLATQKQNTANRSKASGTSSRFVGVSRQKATGKWVARIKINGRLVHLGSFSFEKDAAKAYDKMAYACYDEFANLNFPDELSAIQLPGPNSLNGLYKEPSSKLLFLKLKLGNKTIHFFNTYDEIQSARTLNS